jgi:hypothetical protein
MTASVSSLIPTITPEDHIKLQAPSTFNRFFGFNSRNDRGLTEEEKRYEDILASIYFWDDPKEYADEFSSLRNQPFSMPSSLPTDIPKIPGWNAWDGYKWIHMEDDCPPEYTVFDVETSRTIIGNERSWEVLTAVGLGNFGEIYLWIPTSTPATKPSLDYPFIAHNSSYDVRWLAKPQPSICTMAVANLCYGSSEGQVMAVKGNAGLPWADCTLQSPISLVALANFLNIPHHSKDVRELCKTNDWDTNYKNHLKEIALYCIQDVLLTAKVWNKLRPIALDAAPDPRTWLGLMELSRIRIPIKDPNSWYAWLDNTYAVMDEEEHRLGLKLAGIVLERYDDLLMEYGVVADMIESILSLSFTGLRFHMVRSSGDRKSAKKIKEFTDLINSSLKPIPSLVWEVLEELGNFSDPRLDWKINNVDGYCAPTWVKKYEPVPTNNMLWLALGITKTNSELLTYNHPHFNISKIDGSPAGTVWGKDVDERQFQDDWGSDITIQDYIEYCRATHILRAMRSRLYAIRAMEGEDGNFYYYPDIHKFGTVTGRITDKIMILAPKVSKEVPGSEMLTTFQCPDGYVFVHADYTGQETMIFAAEADSYEGGFLESKFSKVVLSGDLHVVVRDLLGFERSKVGRTKAKGYTFAAQYGSTSVGVENSLILSGYTPAEAKRLAALFIEGWSGKQTGRRAGLSFHGGLASAGYNWAQHWIYGAVPRTPMLKRALQPSLRRSYSNPKMERTLRNFPVQSSGTDIMHSHFSFMRVWAEHTDTFLQPAIAIHDRLGWMCKEEDLPKVKDAVQAGHIYCIGEFYSSLGLKAMPNTYMLFDALEVDDRIRSNPLDPCTTVSNPNGFEPSRWMEN